MRETRSILTGASEPVSGGAAGDSIPGVSVAAALGVRVAEAPTSTDEAMSSAVSSAASTGRTGSGDDGMVTL
ncbi:hypothetical protein BH708_13155 [Brachybacterium sp. P6-10-X1]|nr:hypothetical protein BH708_13155 [Brachybacterium sp. P6-10-X1]